MGPPPQRQPLTPPTPPHHPRATLSRHARASKIRHTRGCRGYLVAVRTKPVPASPPRPLPSRHSCAGFEHAVDADAVESVLWGGVAGVGVR